jgi:ankyrin repeat protein
MGSASSVEAQEDLCSAASSGNVTLVRGALDGGAVLNKVDKTGKSALMHAANAGCVDITDLLLSLGADVNKQGDDGRTALWYAVREGHIQAALRLLQAGANVNNTDTNGRTALALACTIFPPEYLELSAAGSMRDSAAISTGPLAMAELLFEAGALVNAVDKQGATPILTAAKHGHIHIFHRLKGWGADVNHVDNEKCTLLMYASECETTHAITKLLLDTGSSVNQRDSKGRTPLMHASRHGHDDNVRLLLDAGAPVDATDNLGWTALHYAIDKYAWTRWNMLTPAAPRILLNAGASANHLTNNGITPLARACGVGAKKELYGKFLVSMLKTPDLTVVAELLHAGVDVNHADQAGLTVLAHVVQFGYIGFDDEGLARSLLSWGATATHRTRAGVLQCVANSLADVAATRKNQPLLIAARHGEVANVRAALAAGADVNWRDDNEMTALMYATRYGQAEVVDVLVSSGADVNLLQGQRRHTALHHAIVQRNPMMVQKLLLAGADPRLSDRFGRQPLYVACQVVGNTGQYKAGGYLAEADTHVMVQYLLEAGADVNCSNGETNRMFALTQACWGGSAACVQMLLRACAHVNQADTSGYTPICAAVAASRLQHVEMLLAAGALVNAEPGAVSALLCASDPDICRLLIRAGADVNHADDKGYTALMKAVTNHRVSCIPVLLEHGASVELKNKAGLTAIALASDKDIVRGRLAKEMLALLKTTVSVPSNHDSIPVVVHDTEASAGSAAGADN